jgi:hypothetical protein
MAIVTMESVAGPCLTHWAGGYEWYVRYHLPNGAPVDGNLIQELTMQSSDGAGRSSVLVAGGAEVRAGEEDNGVGGGDQVAEHSRADDAGVALLLGVDPSVSMKRSTMLASDEPRMH